MAPDADPSPTLENRIQTVKDGVKLVAHVARPGLTESLKLAREALRNLDNAVAGGLRLMKEPRTVSGLYFILDPEHCNGRDPLAVAELALRGGATIVQWRDKLRDKGDQLPIVRSLRELCDRYVALLIINDHLDLALAGRAAGVHLGQHDLPLSAVRTLVPAEFIVGCSTNNPDEARQAEREGADYVAVGRVFPSSTKIGTRDASPETVREVKQAVTIPVVAIGGITPDNIDEVIRAGADAAAVITAVGEAEDVEEAALVMSKRFELVTEERK